MKKCPAPRDNQDTHPIAVAVEPLRVAAVQQAQVRAETHLARIRQRVEQQPNIHELAPPPHYSLPRAEYEIADSWHKQIMDLVDFTDPDSRRRFWYDKTTPCHVTFSSDKAAKYVAEVRYAADQTYQAFVAKLIWKVSGDAGEQGKVVDTVTAHAPGGVWTESYLTVRFTDGSQTVWKTQQVWNTSVLGNSYVQFPTRKLKPGSKVGVL